MLIKIYNIKTEKLVQAQYTLSYLFLYQYINFCLRVGPAMLCTLCFICLVFGPAFTLHRALTTDVFGGREVVSGIRVVECWILTIGLRLESKKRKGEGGKEHSSIVRRLGVRIVSATKYVSYQAQASNRSRWAPAGTPTNYLRKGKLDKLEK